MPTRIDWLPYGIDERKAALRNLAARIDEFSAKLGLTAAEVDRIKAISEEYSFAVDIYEYNRISIKALRSWRDSVISIKRSNKLANKLPPFMNSAAPVGTRLGLIAEIRRYVRRIKGSPGYTPDIGIPLGILSPNHVKKPLRELKPMIKVKAVEGYRVNISCEKQGMDAVRIEYRRKGEETWQTVAFLMTLPETFYIQPAVMGVPESGQMRAIFIKKNKTVGQYSNMPSVTLYGM